MRIQVICVASDAIEAENHRELGYLIADALQVSFREMKRTDVEVSVTVDPVPNAEFDIVIWLLLGEVEEDVALNYSQRNYKVLLHDIHPEQQPASLVGVRSYHLSKFETRIGKTVTLTVPLIEGYRVYFWLVISDIAHDIYDDLNPSEVPKRMIFLGDTSDDLRMERLLLKRDLKAFGFDSLPKKDYTSDTERISLEQWQDLERSEIAIHLAGGREGIASDNEVYSIQEWQEKVSETYIKQKEGSLKKLVWLPPTIRFTSDKRKFYVEKLLKNIDEHELTLTFKTDLEKFKSILHNELSANEQENSISDVDEVYKKKVYVMSDIMDSDKVNGLVTKLDAMGFGVLTLAQGQGAKLMRRQHQRHLQLCNSTIVYVDQAPTEWIMAKLQDNLRASGLGRKEPLNIKAIVVSSFTMANELTKMLDENHLYKSVGVFTDDDVMISDDLLSFLSAL
ncbi:MULTISPECIES: hypothetical protein [Flammeovirga]|uniref:Uncharacterized protein n=1 Tax=Flammeovirga agarivorans TaxID=2726742 RepID=A0A7X8SI22_9BACT|nr:MULTISPECIES: hypothetical protein [Flammeovirga]NLR90658.1 hypothetical protein [Flammeovirga agarivorans]